MKRTVFKENIWKQIGSVLLLVGMSALAVIVWLPEFVKSKNIILSSLIFVCLLFLIVAVVERITKGRIVFENGELIYGKTIIKADEIEEVRHDRLWQYEVFFAGRKKLIITKFMFSKADQKQIGELLDAMLLKSFISLREEEIEERFENTKYEFEKTEKHVPNIRGLSLLGWVLCFPTLIIFLISKLVLGLKTEEIGELWAIYAMAALFVILGVGFGSLDKFLPKKTFSFKDDRFILSKNGKILRAFSKNRVTRVSVPVTRWSSSNGLTFYIKGDKKPLKIHLIGFSGKDQKEIISAIKKIFYI